MTTFTTGSPHGLKRGDIIQTEPPSFWRILVGAHRITYVSVVLSCSFITSERRMTWREWRRLLWTTARGEG